MNPENDVQRRMLLLIQKIKQGDALGFQQPNIDVTKGVHQSPTITVIEEQEEQLMISEGTELTPAEYELVQLRATHAKDFSAVLDYYLEHNASEIIESNKELEYNRFLQANARKNQEGEWRNDIENIVVKTDHLHHAPYTPEQLVKMVKNAAIEGRKIRFVGSGHSYSEILKISKQQDYFLASENTFETQESIFVDQQAPSTLLKNKSNLLLPGVDANYLVELKSWAPMHRINSELEGKKALATMGAYDVQTIAGVLSTSTHGSRHDMGSTSAMVRSILIIARDGKLLRIEPSKENGAITNKEKYEAQAGEGENAVEVIQNDKYFQSVLVNMGCMGLLYSVVLAVEAPYYLAESRKQSTLETELEALYKEGNFKEYLSYKDTIDYNLLVNPYPQVDGRYGCIRTRRKRHDGSELSKNETKHRSFGVWIATNMAILGKPIEQMLVDFKNWRGVRNLIKLAIDGLASKKDYVSYSNKVYITPRPKNVKGMAIELIVPALKLKEAIYHVLEAIKDLSTQKCDGRPHKKLMTGPISIRFVGQTAAYLSPFTAHKNTNEEVDGGNIFACIEIDCLNKTRCYKESYHYIQQKLLEEMGEDLRIHWGLNFGNLVEDQYQPQHCYPNFGKWKEVYDDLNKHRIFSNPFSSKMGFDEGEPLA